jgi:hypothetical protein
MALYHIDSGYDNLAALGRNVVDFACLASVLAGNHQHFVVFYDLHCNAP